LLACLCTLAAATAVGCGGGERQDANEDEATYDVEVVDAKFPVRQRLGQTSELEITVRNDDSETIPDIAATVDGFYRRIDRDDVADPTRPVFVIDGDPVRLGGYPDVKLAGPQGGPSALVNTWTLGELKPNAEKTFRWRVTAVKAGPFEVSYALFGGLDGNAKVTSVGGAQPRGKFQGTISDEAPPSRIAADGVSVVTPVP
jgi:hypothetical protein